ncbi:MAG TPA: hypothetical protein VFM53_12835 [Anaeromyxobacteraceae bacterium]|nr:hypothetical protein [Anaeromyxobacteraceae bacterium]
MKNLVRIAVLSLGLAVAAPAAAQYTFTQPGQQPQPVQPMSLYENVLRVNVGVSFFNSGYYNCNYWYGIYGPTYTCGSGSFVSYIPFTLGAQLDWNLGGMNNISAGFNVFLGTATGTIYNGLTAVSASKSVTIWEPTLDYVAKFGPPTQDTVGRFRVGAGMYIGPNSELGGAFRIGGGASFLNSNRIGAGLDLVLEGGGYNGYWIGALQLVVSPEFHF